MVDQRNTSEKREARSGNNIEPGPHLALVMNNADSTFSGRLQVWISQYGGDATDERSWHTVQYANPFYGITPYSATKSITNKVSASQFKATESMYGGAATTGMEQRKETMSYGMWTQPPEVGTRVLVVFAGGRANQGFWIAAVPEVAHGMIPAIGKGQSGRPEAEFDPASTEVQTAKDIRKVKRPEHPIAKTYEDQGIDEDELRGFISSSALRESPSKVMGFNTPSGHTLVMDDGDENDESKLIRIRTAGGNQITMHDDTGMIYMINKKGTAWLELSPEGQVDVYGEKGINFATKGEINMHADGNINMHAKSCIKAVADKGAKLQGTDEVQLHGGKAMIQGVEGVHIHSCGEVLITSFRDLFIKAFQNLVIQGKCFKWNSGTAKEAEQVPPEELKQLSGYTTTVARAPSKEPYDQHDNGENSQASDRLESNANDANADVASAADLPAANAAEAGGTIPGYRNVNGFAIPGGDMNSAFVSTVDRITGRIPMPDVRGATFPSVDINSATRTVTDIAKQGFTIPGMGTFKAPSTATIDAAGSKLNATFSNANELGNQMLRTVQQKSTSVPQLQNARRAVSTTPIASTASAPQTSASDVAAARAADKASVPGYTSSQTGTNAQRTAGTAAENLAGQQPGNSIPAAPGGGSTGCFATGDNCGRPASSPAAAGTAQKLTTGQQVQAQEMYDYLRSKGVPDAQAQALVANALRESSLDAGVSVIDSNGLTSGGLFQWNGQRFDAMTAAVPDWQTNWKAQIDYALGGESQSLSGFDVGNWLNSNLDAATASNQWVTGWERPANPTGAQGINQGYLNQFNFAQNI